jgi:hypothetical protein
MPAAAALSWPRNPINNYTAIKYLWIKLLSRAEGL